MDFSRLEHNITDMMKEQQLKLGYRRETIRLYYPLSSLNRFLHTEYDKVQMHQALEDFSRETEPRLGKLTVSSQKDRFCILIPPEGAAYVHPHMEQDGFLSDLIQTVSRHGVTIEEVLSVFTSYSDHVQMEQLEDAEFDYLVYFTDGIPDAYRYCLTNEGCHVTYHRFTKEDYEEMF